MTDFDVLIVGGGHAGAHLAMALRQLDFPGSIAIIGDEPELPYDRPPLSKEYLSGTKAWDRLIFRTAEAWTQRGVTMVLGQSVVRVDPDAHCVETASGDRFDYGKLVWAAGASPRRLTCSGSDAAGIHTVRNRSDVDRMIAELPDVRDVVVIGGGYIGLEAAAALNKLGLQVTVVEAFDRVLARVAGEPLSRFYETAHRAKGVDLRLAASIDCVEQREGRVSGVRLANREYLDAQMIVVGIGVVPEIGALKAAGAICENGVRVDEHCRTSLPDIYAVGDCAEHRNIWADHEWIRLESVQNANDQALTAARHIGGKPEPYQAIPWFWSTQYDLRLQTVGLSRGFDDLVIRGDPASRNFSVVYLRCGQVVALDCVNCTRDYVQGRSLVSDRIRPDRSLLGATDVALKSLSADFSTRQLATLNGG